MLIDFTFSNYRSYKSEQQFSMIADGASSHSFETNFKVCPDALSVSAIYGPNASGKSQVINAMSFMQQFVENGFTMYKPNEKINLSRFALSKKSLKAASKFEVIFTHKETLYQYGFTLDENQVLEEWLYKISANADRQSWKTVLERKYNKKSKKYEYKPASLKKTWKPRKNALSLSAAAYLEETEALNVYEWFVKYWRILGRHNEVYPSFTMKLYRDEKHKSYVEKLVQKADLGIESFFETKNPSNSLVFPENMPEEIKKTILSQNEKTINFRHKSKEEIKTTFSIDEESAGTEIYFGLVGPLIDILNKGYILVVDELERSLHPHLVDEIIGLFHDKKTNKNGAQLIFTAHNTHFMKDMNRDQLWIAEKNEFGESNITSVLSYKPRAETSFDKNYNQGRYGGIPNIIDLKIDEKKT